MQRLNFLCVTFEVCVGQSNSTAGTVLALQAADPCLIPGIKPLTPTNWSVVTLCTYYTFKPLCSFKQLGTHSTEK